MEVGTSLAVAKVVEVVTKGCGGYFAPWQHKRMEKAKAEASQESALIE